MIHGLWYVFRLKVGNIRPLGEGSLEGKAGGPEDGGFAGGVKASGKARENSSVRQKEEADRRVTSGMESQVEDDDKKLKRLTRNVGNRAEKTGKKDTGMEMEHEGRRGITATSGQLLTKIIIKNEQNNQ